MNRAAPARLTAAAIAAAALVAMIPPMLGNADKFGVLGAAWWLLRFFTIITNLLVGVAFGAIALRGREAIGPRVLGGLMLAIVLVGLVFNLLLPPIEHATQLDALGDLMHHTAVPIAVPLWWLAFARHGTLTWRDPLLWALYPLAYAAYSLVRGGLEPADTTLRYPYFFMDPVKLGWPQTFANMAALAAAFIVTGLLAVWLDRRLALSASSSGAGDSGRW